jgi:hypothetical protein
MGDDLCANGLQAAALIRVLQYFDGVPSPLGQMPGTPRSDRDVMIRWGSSSLSLEANKRPCCKLLKKKSQRGVGTLKY